jgi:YggT family protein
MFLYILNILFTTYTCLLFARILGSWIPSFARSKWMRFLAFYTDPYLNLFRRILPPIGGVIDLSPMLALFALQMLQWILFAVIR